MKYYSNIHDAIKVGDLDTIKKSWSKNIDIDYQDENGNSLIMIAAKYNQKKVVNYFLKFKPNLYLWNNQKNTVFSVANQLKDKEIFKMFLDYCWKKGEKMFLFEYHVKPKFETKILGAYSNCWIIDTEFNNAKVKGRNLIEEENWEIISIEDISEIKKGVFTETDEKFQYYEQTIIDKEVLVLYTYDNLAES